MTQSILSIDKLSISIGGSRILRDVSLELAANYVFCVMGRNGVGKTTTLKSVVGLTSRTAVESFLKGATFPGCRLRSGLEPELVMFPKAGESSRI